MLILYIQLFEGSGSFFDPVPPVFVFLSNLAAVDTCPLRIPPSVAAVSPAAKLQKNKRLTTMDQKNSPTPQLFT
jgi:hypothetical protein